MWVRKSDHQMAREHSRVWLSFRGPAIWFLICFVATIALAIQGPRAPVGQRRWPDSWCEALVWAAFDGTVAAAVVYILQIILRRRLNPLTIHAKVVMCDSCHRVERRDSVSKCECGGTFDDFDNWTWIEGDERKEEGEA